MNKPLTIDEILKPYRVHHKDLEACFNDYVAVAHIKQQLSQLISQIIGVSNYETYEQTVQAQLQADQRQRAIERGIDL